MDLRSHWSYLVFQQFKYRVFLIDTRRDHASNRFNHRLLHEYNRSELSSLATASCIWFSCSAPLCVSSQFKPPPVGRQASWVMDPEGQNLRVGRQFKFSFFAKRISLTSSLKHGIFEHQVCEHS